MRNIVLLAIVLLAVGCSETINPGEVGVCIDWGQTKSWTYPEGFHWTGGIGVDVVHMSTQTQTYEMGASGSHGATEGTPESSVDHGEPISVLTRDQLPVKIDATVQFHLRGSAAPMIYRLYGENYADTIVHPNIRTAIRDTASNFTAVDLVDRRAELQNRLERLVRRQVTNVLHNRGVPQNALVIESILVQNIDLPDSLDESIANVARERQATMQRQQALQTAAAESARLRMQAEGEAAAKTIRATAEAEANRTLTASLTPSVLELRRIEATRAILEDEHTRTVMVPASGLTLMMQQSE